MNNVTCPLEPQMKGPEVADLQDALRSEEKRRSKQPEGSLPQLKRWGLHGEDSGPQFTELLKKAAIQISMDGMGQAIDNIVVERLWRSVKHEVVSLKDYPSNAEAHQNIKSRFGFCNNERLH